LEHFVYDAEGQLLTGSFADYLLPTASDFPSIRAIALEEKPSPNNPLGAKGAGEGGIIPVGGVIANAIAAALGSLGVEPRALPLSPPKVWELIQERVFGESSPRKRGPMTTGSGLWVAEGRAPPNASLALGRRTLTSQRPVTPPRLMPSAKMRWINSG